MKKSILLNSEISYVISKMGHQDQLVVGDAGLPIPAGVQRIDLTITKNIPRFLPVLDAVLSELKIEKVILAKEIKEVSPALHNEILDKIQEIEIFNNINVKIEYVSHIEFKEKISKSNAIIRTGEFTPYANIILISGVVF